MKELWYCEKCSENIEDEPCIVIIPESYNKPKRCIVTGREVYWMKHIPDLDYKTQLLNKANEEIQ